MAGLCVLYNMVITSNQSDLCTLVHRFTAIPVLLPRVYVALVHVWFHTYKLKYHLIKYNNKLKFNYAQLKSNQIKIKKIKIC